MVSYTGNILGIQNQIIPFGALSIRWNKLQSLLVTTVMNDRATSLWFFIHSFIDNGVDRTRPASNGLNPAQVPF